MRVFCPEREEVVDQSKASSPKSLGSFGENQGRRPSFPERSAPGRLRDLEDAFRQWRFRHVTTVERIIGFKRGTGGTSGVSYLRRMLDVVLFPELWKVRTDL